MEELKSPGANPSFRAKSMRPKGSGGANFYVRVGGRHFKIFNYIVWT
jgi:hypothetical protein